MFFRTPFLLPLVSRKLVWRKPVFEKKIFLTFDDGPIPGPTEFVLEELARFNARATFFCIGDNVRKYPNVFEKILAAGHSIGNHTFNHLKGWQTKKEEYIKNIRLCEAEFNKFQWDGMNEDKLKLFRPPYGRIKPNQVNALNDYSIIMWDVLTHDYSKSYSSDECLQGSIQATRPGSIVVFHDSLKAERNLTYVLPRYLEYFSQRGFLFEKL